MFFYTSRKRSCTYSQLHPAAKVARLSDEHAALPYTTLQEMVERYDGPRTTPLGEGSYGSASLNPDNGFVTKQLQNRDHMLQEAKNLRACRGLKRVQQLEAVCVEDASLVTPYEGDSLENHLRKGSLSLKNKLYVLEQICKAAQGMHTRGLVHLDIKPNNICVRLEDCSYMATLIDVGIAAPMGGKVSFPGKFKPGQHYAPETRGGKKANVNELLDVFAIGQLAKTVLHAEMISIGLAETIWSCERVRKMRPTIAELIDAFGREIPGRRSRALHHLLRRRKAELKAKRRMMKKGKKV